MDLCNVLYVMFDGVCGWNFIQDRYRGERKNLVPQLWAAQKPKIKSRRQTELWSVVLNVSSELVLHPPN